jgi:hypothetical protein
MPMLRLLAASLLASACAVTAAAQSHANALPLTATITTQPFTFNAPTAPSTTFLKSARPGSFHFDTPKDSNSLQLPAANTQPLGGQMKLQELAQLKLREAQLAQNNQPCAKLRVYGFTPQDLKSSHPHASSETDCTPASAGHLKTIPATSDPK